MMMFTDLERGGVSSGDVEPTSRRVELGYEVKILIPANANNPEYERTVNITAISTKDSVSASDDLPLNNLSFVIKGVYCKCVLDSSQPFMTRLPLANDKETEYQQESDFFIYVAAALTEVMNNLADRGAWKNVALPEDRLRELLQKVSKKVGEMLSEE